VQRAHTGRIFASASLAVAEARTARLGSHLAMARRHLFPDDRPAGAGRAVARLVFFDPLLRKADRATIAASAVETAIALTGAEKGNLQRLDPVQGGLRIEAQRGFDRQFLGFFAHVTDDRSACGLAFRRGTPIVVPAVSKSPIFTGTPALDVLTAVGVRAVLSAPLLWEGGILGVLSIHYGRGAVPTEGDARMLSLVGRRAARLLAGESLVRGPCAACGEVFVCGAGEPSCWCATVPLSHEARARAARTHRGCLCPTCLHLLAGGRLADRAEVRSIARIASFFHLTSDNAQRAKSIGGRVV
jgi:hypothetical protein